MQPLERIAANASKSPPALGSRIRSSASALVKSFQGLRRSRRRVVGKIPSRLWRLLQAVGELGQARRDLAESFRHFMAGGRLHLTVQPLLKVVDFPVYGAAHVFKTHITLPPPHSIC